MQSSKGVGSKSKSASTTTPHRSRSSRRYLAALDSEDDGKGNPYLFAVVHARGSWTGASRDAALDVLAELERKHGAVEVWCTNLEYDLVNLYGAERVAELVLRFSRSSLVGGHWRGHRVHFRDTVRHLPMSVKELGTMVGLPKLTRDRSVAYCVRDTTITYRAAKLIHEAYRRHGERPRMTIASTAYHIWQARHWGRKVFAPADEIREAARSAYHGGRTETFALGEFKRAHAIDAASMFPWAMVAAPLPLPWGDFVRVRAGEPIVGSGLYRVRAEVPDTIRPSLPVRTRYGTVFPAGRFSGWYVGEELLHALATGTRIEVMAGYRFPRIVRPFDSYVRKMFRAKSRSRGGRRAMAKLLLNALYGKFGQRGERIRAVPLRQLHRMESPPRDFRVWNGLAFYREDGPPPPWGNFVWAAFVTARARVRLHRELLKIERAGRRPLYCDTDSVVYVGDPIRYPSKAVAPGEFESRGDYRRVLLVGKKEYGLQDSRGRWTYHVKGVPIAQRAGYLREGRAEFARPVRMRESARVHVPANVWRTVRKQRQPRRDRREPLADGALPVMIVREGD